MSRRRWIPAIALLALLGAALAGFLSTQGPDPTSGFQGVVTHRASKGAKAGKKPKAGKTGMAAQPAASAHAPDPVVDEAPLRTARALGALALTSEEQDLARQAGRLANHEVDLAFADAMRQVASLVVPSSPDLEDLRAEKEVDEEAVKADQRQVAELSRRVAEAQGDRKNALNDQLEVAKAQLELDQDDLEMASEALEKAGGDPQAKVRRLRAAHDAVQNEPVSAPPPESRFQPDSLVGRLGAWRAWRIKQSRLGEAQRDAQQKIQELQQRRDALAQDLVRRNEARRAALHQATGVLRSEAVPGGEDAKAAMSSLKQFVEAQQTLVSLGKRIQDEQDLSEVYGSWLTLAEAYTQGALHRVLQSILWILGVLGSVFLTSLAVERATRPAPGEPRRSGKLGTVLPLVAGVMGLLAILFIVLGVPGQTTTILGLAGAGLTVALKDFIVAFFGWFILMGRNGIHVGDWVEIKGVGGEVVEIGLLRTVLLETGNWSDAGHPTGRRVAFVNSFAIEGHYFNFSTSGQWMWDELNVLIPAGQDPYPVIDGIQKLVVQQTEANARQAEQEWQGATSRYRVQAFSAEPGLNVRPTNLGIEVRVRYITRAYQRHESRGALYQAVVELMHGRRPEEGDPTGAGKA